LLGLEYCPPHYFMYLYLCTFIHSRIS